MEDLAREVLQQMRAEDGDLDVYVRFHYLMSNYAIQPTMQGGKLMWRWEGKEFDNKYSMVFENLDDFLDFVDEEFGFDRLGTTQTFALIILNKKEQNTPEDVMFKHRVESGIKGRDKMKKFLLRCEKIKIK